MITNEWRKSSYSALQDCVEVRLRAGTVEVRDSKEPEGTRLQFERAEWAAFIEEIQ